MSDPGTEIASEAAKAVAVSLARPVVEVLTDLIGGTIGDPLRNWRRKKPAWEERNRRDTLEQTVKLLIDRGIKNAAEDARPECVEEIIDASGETAAPELRELYAKLIAAALDPKRAPFYRREFLEIVKKLEPIDALVLPMLNTGANLVPTRRAWLAARLSRSEDDIEVAFRNLLKLEMTEKTPPAGNNQNFPTPTALGKQFLLSVG